MVKSVYVEKDISIQRASADLVKRKRAPKSILGKHF